MCRLPGTDSDAPRARSDAGFTLLETLVALIIFVAAYLLIHQALSLGWRGVRLAQSETAALQVAQARLAAAGLEQPLAEGNTSGEASGYSWTTIVRRVSSEPGAAPSTLSGFWVTVSVNWRDAAVRQTRSVQLTTLKLAVRP